MASEYITCISTDILTALSKKSAIFSKSFSFNPRDVSAGDPSRIPPGEMALTSPATAFLFTVILLI